MSKNGLIDMFSVVRPDPGRPVVPVAGGMTRNESRLGYNIDIDVEGVGKLKLFLPMKVALVLEPRGGMAGMDARIVLDKVELLRGQASW